MKFSGKVSPKTLDAKPLKILHAGNHTFPCVGGIENVIWSHSREQARSGHDVRILVFNTCSKGIEKLSASEKKDGVHLMRVSRRGLAFYPLPPILTLIREARKVDLVHVHGLGSWMDIFALTQFIHRKPIVVNTHGGFHHTSKRAAVKKVYQFLLNTFLMHLVDFFCVDSPSDLSLFGKISSSKYAIIPDGADLEKFRTLPLAKKDPFRFIFVGRLSRNKRIDRLIDVFSILSKKDPRFRLVIVGEDWEGLRPALEERVRRTNTEKVITFTGAVSSERLLEEYARAGFVVSASEYEGFGISMIEGMAAGCVPCGNAIPTFTQFIGEKNERGIIVRFADEKDAAESILNEVTHSKEFVQKQKAARKYALQFSVENVTREHLSVYERILSGKGVNE